MPLIPIVFLHVPKTAGQTVFHQLAHMVGAGAVSPVRVHTDAAPGAQMPPGYAFYAGHLDWAELDLMPQRFAFTILRDPAERIASFYFFLLDEAHRLTDAQLALPQHHGKHRVRNQTAEDYFFGGTMADQRFIRDHYDNFYCQYFASRKMRGWAEVAGLPPSARIAAAQLGLARLDRVYALTGLAALEHDIAARYGHTITLVDNFQNTGTHGRDEPRWPKLMARIGSDAARQRLETFVTEDTALLNRVTLATG